MLTSTLSYLLLCSIAVCLSRLAHPTHAYYLANISQMLQDRNAFQDTNLTREPRLEPRASGLAGYIATYFKNDGDERIYMSTSTDAHSWKPVKGGQVILSSNVGTGGARDPVLVTNSGRSQFYVIATDLKASATTWSQATKTGSHSLVMWSSSDLKSWSSARLLHVEGADAGMTWAPAVVEDGGKWNLFWTSSHSGHFGIFHSETSDFSSFTAPQEYAGTGAGCMDMDLARVGSGWVRAMKCGTIKVETGGSLFGSWTTIASGIEPGEGPAVFADNGDGSIHLWVDENSGRGYTSYVRSGGGFSKEANQIASGMRHGNVLPATESEIAALQR